MSKRPPRPHRLARACALICLLQAGPGQAQTVMVERQTIEQLRATTMALIDALDRQTQQTRAQQEQMARQAIEQQRVTTLALIEVLASQGLLSRDKADTLARLSMPAGLPAAPTYLPSYAPAPAPAPGPAAMQAYAPPTAAQPAATAPAPPPLPVPIPVPLPMAAPVPMPMPQPQSPAPAQVMQQPAAAAATPVLPAAAAPPARQPAWGDPIVPAPAATATVRVPYVSETLRAQLRNEIRNDVLAVAREERWADPRLLPDWVRGLSLHGDLRVRAEHDHLPDTNYAAFNYRAQAGTPAWSPDLLNTTLDRSRLTLRARMALDARLGDDFEAGLRLGTGSTSGPTSSSQTLGTGFNKAPVVLDRAFIKWEPLQDLRLLAGRFGNPFFGGDLLWPDDLGFDGVALQGERNITSGVFAFATAGAFPLEEFNVDKRDKWLYGLQLGVDVSVGSRTQWRTALAVYDFQNVEGIRETQPAPSGARAGTVPYFDSQYPANLRLKGNTLINLNDPTSTAAPTWGLASKFRPINLATALTLRHFEPIEVMFGFDYVKNSAFDVDDIGRRAGVSLGDTLRARTTGLQAKLSLGKVKLGERGDWQLSGALRHFERDAWLDGLTDTTWNLGGTSYRGWSIAGQYALDRRAALGLRVTSTRNLDDGWRKPGSGEGNLSSAPLRIDVLQVDLQARF